MKKNEILYEIRSQKHMTQVEFAGWLGIPYKTYKAYENYLRIPRNKQSKKIINKLKKYGVVSPAIFHIPQDKDCDEIWGVITKRIANYMNSKSNKNFLPIHVSTIRKSLLMEKQDRPSEVNAYTNEGKEIVNSRTAKIANNILGISFFTKDDVKSYKQCEDQEYEDRTGKSTWGIPSERKRSGFNQETGYEID